jgi:abortive infection bacteriophage resistance protein
MNRSVNVSKDEKFIKHYNSHYSDPVTPPVWSYIEVSSIGELNSWIKNLKPTSITDKIAHGFKLGNSKVFISFLDRLRIFRNICAHHGRIWNTRFEKRKLTIPQQPPDLNSAWNSGNNTDSSFYGMFLMMFFVLKHLDKSEAEHLLESFKNISNQYNIDINELGFSLNWLNETIFDN